MSIETPDSRVEAPQIAILRGEQALEGGHTVEVGGHRREVRVVDALLEPSPVAAGLSLAALERLQVELQHAQDFALAHAHRPRIERLTVERCELPPVLRQERDRFRPVCAARKRMLESRAAALGAEPATQSFLLDRDCKGLVESGVAAHVHDLVRKLMEEHCGELVLAPCEHGAHHGIGEVPERRIGRHATHEHVTAFACHPLGEAACRAFAEIAPIGEASHDRKAPVLGFHGKLACRHHVPDDVRAVELHEGPIARVVRQRELGRGKGAHRAHRLQPFAQRRGRTLVTDQPVDRLAGRHHPPLPACGLQHIGRPAP